MFNIGPICLQNLFAYSHISYVFLKNNTNMVKTSVFIDIICFLV